MVLVVVFVPPPLGTLLAMVLDPTMEEEEQNEEEDAATEVDVAVRAVAAAVLVLVLVTDAGIEDDFIV